MIAINLARKDLPNTRVPANKSTQRSIPRVFIQRQLPSLSLSPSSEWNGQPRDEIRLLSSRYIYIYSRNEFVKFWKGNETIKIEIYEDSTGYQGRGGEAIGRGKGIYAIATTRSASRRRGGGGGGEERCFRTCVRREEEEEDLHPFQWIALSEVSLDDRFLLCDKTGISIASSSWCARRVVKPCLGDSVKIVDKLG